MRYDFLPLQHFSAAEHLHLSETMGADAAAQGHEETTRRFYESAEYYMDMESWSMPLFEISQTARECLLYPESFSIILGNADYFTMRSGLDSFELRYTLEGKGRLEYGSKTYDIVPGTGYWIDCRQPHRYGTAGDRWKSTILHFGGKSVAAMFQVFAAGGQVTFSDALYPAFETMQEQLLRSTQDISAAGQFKTSCALDRLLTNLLDQKHHAYINGDTARHMERIAAWLKEHHAGKISGEMLSRRFSISRAYMATAFKAYTGLTVSEFLTQTRLSRAKTLLMNTPLSVEIVAQQVGYENTSSFIRAFRQHEGITPLQYRKMLR